MISLLSLLKSKASANKKLNKLATKADKAGQDKLSEEFTDQLVKNNKAAITAFRKSQGLKG